ncbi:MAG: hypothetical protein GVY16_07910 [Planctomycetes bacterium]|jgi:hypothetical protein|nr:hypothetical protein [Planctomycetota bacterium]
MTRGATEKDHPYRNPERGPRQRAGDLLKHMTLREKVAQLQCLPGSEDLPQRIEAHGIGSLASPLRDLTAGDAARLANRIQQHVRDLWCGPNSFHRVTMQSPASGSTCLSQSTGFPLWPNHATTHHRTYARLGSSGARTPAAF